ncbi:MAG: DUF58 domain-containing protein [Proteobacteria bacterium]|nr:DUF58 domain-containing protein [Pseudomonadota bacterium]
MSRPALPISRDMLRRALFRAQREMSSMGLGPSRRRRSGQSLEYREHREFVPGTDVRNIDWRASVRYKGPFDHLVRAHEAEEQYAMIVALDVRAEMWLPEHLPTMQLGLWLVEALGELAVAAKLSANILPLFGNAARPTRPLRGSAITTLFRSFLDDVWNGRPQDERSWTAPAQVATSDLIRHLPPAAVVVVITDGTFGDDQPGFANIIRKAQDAHRHVALIILDGWPVERALLEQQSVQLLPFGAFTGRAELADPTARELDIAGTALHAARQRMRAQAGGLAVSQWTMSRNMAKHSDLEAMFREQFEAFLHSSQIFALGGR